MNLKDRNGKIIKIKNIDVINKKIKELEDIHLKNPTKDMEGKMQSLLMAETFSSLFTEGDISSRRAIKETFVKKQPFSTDMLGDFVGAYRYALAPKEFSISNMFTLYSIVSKNGIEEDSRLPDGFMFRQEPVYISRNGLKENFRGFDHKNIAAAFNGLFEFLNDTSENPYFRAVLGHIYFELIHPFFDFNGRTGRFIPMWVFTNEDNKNNHMMYFATAVGNYREQYLSLFNKNIDTRTFVVDFDRIILGMLDLLILNQKQYIWYKKLEEAYTDKTNKSFNALQKDFVWKLMIKAEVSAGTGWFKLTKSDREYIELDMLAPQFSRDVRILAKAGVLDISSDKNRKYKLHGYKVFKK